MVDFDTPEPWERGRWDVAYWALVFLGIRLHPGQVRMAQAATMRDVTGWRAAYLTICVAAGNRAGKTMALAIVILHSVFYKMGARQPVGDKEAERWWKRQYLWFHFAIQQEIAELVFTEIANIFQGIHVAQRDGKCPVADWFATTGGKIAEWEKKYNGDYRWVVLHPLLGGGEIHFRTTAEGALGSLGRDMHGISFDECGFAKNLKYVIDNVLHLRRLGTGGQLFLVSTPEEGLTEFADEWFLGDPEQPDQRPKRISLRMSTRDNIGYGLEQSVFDSLVADMDEDHIKQNIDGYFIQGRTAYFNASSVDRAFIEDMPEMLAAKNRHTYVQGVDPAVKVDSMWSIVFDVLDNGDGTVKGRGVRVERSRGKKTTDGIVELAESVHFAYDVNRAGLRSWCSTAIDATGFGGHMFQDALNEKIPGGVRSIEFGGTTQKKRKLLGDLRTMLDSGRLQMPRSGLWLQVRRQLLGYKLDDRHIEQDAVMALACAVAEMRRTLPEADGTPVTFDAFSVGEPPVKPQYDWRRQPITQ